MEKFPHFIFAVQEKYNQYQNPYHNYEHGINVLHATYLFIKTTKVMEHLDEFDNLCLLFSALMHDINHTGKTNGFEENSFSNLAIQYNDISVNMSSIIIHLSKVLESHHVATTFKMLRKKRLNVFHRLSYQ